MYRLIVMHETLALARTGALWAILALVEFTERVACASPVILQLRRIFTPALRWHDGQRPLPVASR